MKDCYPSPLEINQELIDAIASEGYLSAPRAPSKPMPTYEEISAYLHRAANPTPADRAAAMLNGELPQHGPVRFPEMILLRGI